MKIDKKSKDYIYYADRRNISEWFIGAARHWNYLDKHAIFLKELSLTSKVLKELLR